MGDTLIMRKKERLRKSIFDLVRAGHCTQQEASLKLGISCRHTRRSYQRYLKEGDKSLVHGNRGKKPGCAYPEEFNLKKAVDQFSGAKFELIFRILHSHKQLLARLRQ